MEMPFVSTGTNMPNTIVQFWISFTTVIKGQTRVLFVDPDFNRLASIICEAHRCIKAGGSLDHLCSQKREVLARQVAIPIGGKGTLW
jgi:hypothetical protein